VEVSNAEERVGPDSFKEAFVLLLDVLVRRELLILQSHKDTAKEQESKIHHCKYPRDNIWSDILLILLKVSPIEDIHQRVEQPWKEGLLVKHYEIGVLEVSHFLIEGRKSSRPFLAEPSKEQIEGDLEEEKDEDDYYVRHVE